MSEYTTFLKIGSTACMLRMLEDSRVVLRDMTLENPIRAIREISHDITCTRKVRLANGRSGEGFTAVSAEARKKFWADRKKTAAISRHTNAFKINEDVVIPLPRMAEYTDGIERINIELSLRNKLQLCDELDRFFARGHLPLGKAEDGDDIASPEQLEDHVSRAREMIAGVRALWQSWLDQCDALFPQLQSHELRASWKTQIRAELAQIFTGQVFQPLLDECNAIHRRVLKGRVWVALHAHAGDGNVHTNIPVNSDDYAMLQTAHEAVGRIMRLARSLDGVISGEHGIGITKLDYLTDEELAPFANYKQRVDPQGHFNRGKLLRGAAPSGPLRGRPQRRGGLGLVDGRPRPDQPARP